MRARAVALLCSLAVLAGACASTGSGVSSVRSRPVGAPDTSTGDTTPGVASSTSTTRPGTTATPTTGPARREVVSFGQGRPGPQPYDAFLVAAATDIEGYWAEQYPLVYVKPFQPLEGAIYAIYPTRTDPPSDCDGKAISYDRVHGNAFYTDCGDLVAYDDSELLPQLVGVLGQAAVGVVLAHEFGHAVQKRAGIFQLNLPTVATEQQADCFAGAWAAHVARGESDLLRFTDADVRSGLIAMIQVADPVGIDVNVDADAHGTAFDRVGAFQEGFINGARRCVGFVDDPPPLINLTFLNATDASTGGNLPFGDIQALIPASLDKYWSQQLAAVNVSFTTPGVQPFPAAGPYPTCDGFSGRDFPNSAFYCASTNTIVYDDDLARKFYDQLGDFSIGYLISDAYSEAVQLALKSSLKGEDRALLDDCLTGSWVLHIIPRPDGTQIDDTQPIVLSPGDLDEAVTTAVKIGDNTADTNVIGSAFEKIASFRSGVLGGLDTCSTRIH